MTTAQLLLSASNAPPPDEPFQDADQQARISFRQPVSTAGYIDAGWWPRTHDLATELPALMDVLWTAGREICGVSYNLHEWDRAPRHMHIDGRVVQLAGFNVSVPSTVTLRDLWGRERIDILVIAPGTDPAVAQRILGIASTADDPYSAQEILGRANGTLEVANPS